MTRYRIGKVQVFRSLWIRCLSVIGMSYKDISSTNLHFTGKAEKNAPWMDVAANTSDGMYFKNSYARAAIARMQREDLEATAEKQKQIAEKLAKYKAEEEEMELAKQKKLDLQKKASQETRAKLVADSSASKRKTKKDKSEKHPSKKGKKSKKAEKKKKKEKKERKRTRKR